MKLKEMGNMSIASVVDDVKNGGKFVVYMYTISILVLTFRRNSEIYFFRAGESRVSSGLLFSLITAVLGWWGIPWGPIYSIQSLWTNFSGGKDVTEEILAKLQEMQIARKIEQTNSVTSPAVS